MPAGMAAGVLILLAGVTAATAAAADDGSCRAIPVDADGPLRSALARETFGTDGTGVTVGIVSGSFDVDPTVTDLARDVALGALPGPGNPCGRTQPVEILIEGAEGDDDEGRAMAQIVHGIAPGARLLFASAEHDQAAAIRALAAAGADIIVDDIWQPVEPLFQRGIVGTAVQEVVDAGVLYVAAAGNYGVVGDAAYGSAGRPIGGWQTAAYRPTACPAEIEAASTGPVDCLDADPGPGQTPWNTVTLAPEALVPLVLQWGEPVNQTGGTSLDLWALDPDGSVRAHLPAIPGGNVAVGLVANPDAAAAETRIVVSRQLDAGTPGMPPVRWNVINNRPSPTLLALQFDRDTGDDLVGGSMGGHAAYGAAIPVAAADWRTPDVVRGFSSLGPVTQLFGPQRADRLPAAPLAEPIVVPGPAIAGVDAVRTTFFPGSSPEHRFAGTSAAAPTVAGVLALARALDPGASVDALRAAMTTTAAPMRNPYPGVADARVHGAGRIDAYALLTAIAPTLVPAPNPQPAVLAASGGAVPPGVPVLALAALVAGACAIVLARRPRFRRR